MTPCTRKAPGLRNGTRATISKGDPRRLVVWGITCDQRPVLIAEGDADDERGPGLAGHAEIDEPDLTAQRDRHLAR